MSQYYKVPDWTEREFYRYLECDVCGGRGYIDDKERDDIKECENCKGEGCKLVRITQEYSIQYIYSIQ